MTKQYYLPKQYYYCEECQNTVEFNHECVMDKITRMDMGKAFNAWLKEQPESETSPIRKHTKALGEVSYALEALEKENLELKHQIHELQLQVGDWQDAAEQTIAAARGTRLDAAGERQLRELVEERTELCKTVAFFASVIKSGESWSDTCQTMYNNTIIHLPSRK